MVEQRAIAIGRGLQLVTRMLEWCEVLWNPSRTPLSGVDYRAGFAGEHQRRDARDLRFVRQHL
jgi:hypothetical protein